MSIFYLNPNLRLRVALGAALPRDIHTDLKDCFTRIIACDQFASFLNGSSSSSLSLSSAVYGSLILLLTLSPRPASRFPPLPRKRFATLPASALSRCRFVRRAGSSLSDSSASSSLSASRCYISSAASVRGARAQELFGVHAVVVGVAVLDATDGLEIVSGQAGLQVAARPG